MKTVSARAQAAMAAQETADEPLVAVTISHASLASPIRIIDAAGDVVKDGNTYSWWPFRVVLPGEAKDELPTASLEIDAVDRTIGDAIRGLSGAAPSIEMDVVLAATPDTVEFGPYYFDLRAVDGDVALLRAELAPPPILDERCPGGSMTPDKYPALFDA